MSSYARILTSDTYVGSFGPIEGFTYPQMGGQMGDLVSFASYTAQDTFLALYGAIDRSFVVGLNSTTPTSAGALLGFGDFAVSSRNHTDGVGHGPRMARAFCALRTRAGVGRRC